MNHILTALLVLVSFAALRSQTLESIIYNGDDAEHINIVILGDGYTASNHASNKLRTDGLAFANDLLNTSPFSEYANYFNFYIIKRNSVQTGADHPGTATDVTEPASPVQTRNTAYGSSFDIGNIHRLLAPDGNGNALALSDLAALVPAFDQAVMLVNDMEYGGSGGMIATSSLNSQSTQIAIHELAHSFADLADEYYAGDQFAGERPNMTMNSNPNTVKWSDWVNQIGVGVYQHTCSTGNCNAWYKPHQSCKMQFLSSNFCSVCKEAIIDVIYSLVDPFKDKVPNYTNSFSFNGSSATYGSNLIATTPNSYTIEWVLNGNVVANRSNSLEQWTFEDFQPGFNGLMLRVIDETNLSKSYAPDAGYVFELIWIVNKQDLCTETIDKFDFVNSFPSGSGAGQPTSDDFDWVEWGGGTSTTGTGPQGAYDGSTYLLIEACCTNIPVKTAVYYTECFDLRSLNKPKFSLAIHLFGADIGTLKIEVTDGPLNLNSYATLATFTKEIGPDWKEFEYDLEPYISPYTKIRITATTGSGVLGDMAIDYLQIYESCPSSSSFSQAQSGVHTYKAEHNILSTSTILNGSTSYQAGQSILLNPNFTVESGAMFQAKFGGCN